MTGLVGPLGPLVVLTDRRQAEAAGHALPAVVHAAVEAGATAVLFREKDLGRSARKRLGEQVKAAVVGQAPTPAFVVASDVDMALELRADGVHLARADRSPPSSQVGLVGRSCHDEAELRSAATAGAHYVTLSPVFATPSKPGYGPALGASTARELADRLGPNDPAVYPLGGIAGDEAGQLGAVGFGCVAVMGAVMGADDPGAATEAVRCALTEDGR